MESPPLFFPGWEIVFKIFLHAARAYAFINNYFAIGAVYGGSLVNPNVTIAEIFFALAVVIREHGLEEFQKVKSIWMEGNGRFSVIQCPDPSE